MDQSYIAYIEQVSKSKLTIHLKHHGCKKMLPARWCTRSRICVEFKDLSMTMTTGWPEIYQSDSISKTAKQVT